MISYNEYLEKYRNGAKVVYGYHNWIANQLTAEYRIENDWYLCIPLADACVYPFEDYYISVITRNGTHEHLKRDEFRLIS